MNGSGLLTGGLSAWPDRPVGAKGRLEDLFREGWLSQPRRMLQRPGMLRTAFEAMTSSEATATVYCVLTPARWNHLMEPPQAANPS